MKTALIATLVLGLLVLVFVLKSFGQSKSTSVQENPYPGFRQMTFDIVPTDLELDVGANQVFQVIVDWDLGNAIVTITAMSTGDASLYISTGQAFIGGFAHESVASAAKELVEVGQPYLSKAKKHSGDFKARKGQITFWLKTADGIYVYSDSVSNIENDSSEWVNLFRAANQVMTEYRLLDESKKSN